MFPALRIESSLHNACIRDRLIKNPSKLQISQIRVHCSTDPSGFQAPATIDIYAAESALFLNLVDCSRRRVSLVYNLVRSKLWVDKETIYSIYMHTDIYTYVYSINDISYKLILGELMAKCSYTMRHKSNSKAMKATKTKSNNMNSVVYIQTYTEYIYIYINDINNCLIYSITRLVCSNNKYIL